MPDSLNIAPVNPNLALSLPQTAQMPGLIAAAGTSTDPAKIEKAAQEFESILLAQWMEQARESFAGVPGQQDEEADDAGQTQMLSLGMQSLATAIAKSGGIGIARLISRHLGQPYVAGIPTSDAGQHTAPLDSEGREDAGAGERKKM